MIFDYRCLCCKTVETRQVRSAERDRQRCERCGSVVLRLPHFHTLAITIPRHMRAEYDKTVEQIAPPEPELRRQWLERGYEQGVIKRKRADLGM